MLNEYWGTDELRKILAASATKPVLFLTPYRRRMPQLIKSVQDILQQKVLTQKNWRPLNHLGLGPNEISFLRKITPGPDQPPAFDHVFIDDFPTFWQRHLHQNWVGEDHFFGLVGSERSKIYLEMGPDDLSRYWPRRRSVTPWRRWLSERGMESSVSEFATVNPYLMPTHCPQMSFDGGGKGDFRLFCALIERVLRADSSHAVFCWCRNQKQASTWNDRIKSRGHTADWQQRILITAAPMSSLGTTPFNFSSLFVTFRPVADPNKVELYIHYLASILRIAANQANSDREKLEVWLPWMPPFLFPRIKKFLRVLSCY